MRSIKSILILLFISSVAFAQYQNVIDYGPVHARKLTITVLVTSGSASVVDKDSIWIQFPDRFDFNRGWEIDTLAAETLVAAGFDTLRRGLWSGFGEIDIKFINTDLAADSLQIKCYSVNSHAEVSTNDYVYLSFDTPPSCVTSDNSLDWTDGLTYRASITGAFGYGTQGLLFEINGCDATSSHEGLLRFDIYLK